MEKENKENKENEDGKKNKENKVKKFNKYKALRIFFSIACAVFVVLFINDVFIQPYRSKKAMENIKLLYPNNENKIEPTDIPEDLTNTNHDDLINDDDTPGQPSNVKDDNEELHQDSNHILTKFSELLNVNEDVKGWLTIPDSNMDFPVLQSSIEEPEYYLNKNLFKQTDKAGSIFLDISSSVENKSQNYVIHGHNMTTTDNMFHYLLEYNKLDYYRERPVITFDTIYEEGSWKIFSIFKTNGSSRKEALFDFTRSEFSDGSDFLNYIYQFRIRSIYDFDVDIKEDDQIITLSTCSYELNDYRTVVVARKVRDGEDTYVNVDHAKRNENPVYPKSWYINYGGDVPEYTPTFEDALELGEIDWYTSN